MISPCPACGAEIRVIQIPQPSGKRTVSLLCESCYDAGAETSLTVVFDRPIEGVTPDYIAGYVWGLMCPPPWKPYPVDLSKLEESK